MVVTAQLLRKCFTIAKILASPFSFQAKNFASSTSSPLIMLPSTEAAAAANVYMVRNSCFYNVQNQTFVTNEDFNVCCSKAQVDERVRRSKIVGSSHGWLVYLDYDAAFFPLTMAHALSSKSVTLPHIAKPPKGVSSCHVRESGDGGLEFIGFLEENGGKSFRGFTRSVVDYAVDKVVMSPHGHGHGHGVVMALHGLRTMLSYHRPGDDEWTSLEKTNSKYIDVLYGQHDHKFYALRITTDGDRNFEVLSWDFCDPSNPKKESYLIMSGGCAYSKYEYLLRKVTAKNIYLAQLSGKILMILRHFGWHVTKDHKILRCESDKSCKYPYKTVAWDVIELDPATKMWVPVKSLGDKALFLGINNPFVLSASEFPGLKPDTIYFTDDQGTQGHTHSGPDSVGPSDFFYPFGGHDCGIFNMEDGSFSPCFQTESKLIFHPPVWIAPH